MTRLISEDDANSVAEFALVVPIFLFIVLASMQLALIGIVRYDVKHVTRETARWLAVNPDATDAGLSAHVAGDVLPGMVAGNILSASATPACPSLSAGHCAARSSGTVLTVSVLYDASNVYFLPVGLGPGPGLSLPPLRVNSQVSMVEE